MWQKLSLRARLNMLLALVLTLGLAFNIARLMLEAAPRVQAEDQSVIRLAREFIETLVAGLNETPDPDARLNQIVRDLNRLRHVSITRQDHAIEDTPLATDRANEDREAQHSKRPYEGMTDCAHFKLFPPVADRQRRPM